MPENITIHVYDNSDLLFGIFNHALYYLNIP